MADDDMADPMFDDEDDFDWFYVEDTCPLAVSHAHLISGSCSWPAPFPWSGRLRQNRPRFSLASHFNAPVLTRDVRHAGRTR